MTAIKGLSPGFVAERIERARRIAGMTQEDLANAANEVAQGMGIERRLSRGKINSLEHDRVELKISDALLIAVATGQPLQFFAGGQGTIEPKFGQLDFELGRGVAIDPKITGDFEDWSSHLN